MLEPFRLPTKKNAKLRKLLEEIRKDKKLVSLWKCANITAIDRMGFSDHGPTHIKIIANSTLRILRILIDAGVTPSIVKDYGMSNDDAEVVVTLASVLHDLGISIMREEHEVYSFMLALEFIEKYLPGIYNEEETAIMTTEILHAIISHHRTQKPLTIEAGVVRVGDALDMEKGRARIPFEAGKVNIHSVSALSIENVSIEKGDKKPIVIKIRMSNSAGIFQVDELLRKKIQNSGIEDYIHVIAEIVGEKEPKIITTFEL
ncbi:phosphohydrolase [Candidatus Bathyarchaeota archaeon]|nr:phosphohydrolase [Candidatus Bathyarchaeota archaeon]